MKTKKNALVIVCGFTLGYLVGHSRYGSWVVLILTFFVLPACLAYCIYIGEVRKEKEARVIIPSLLTRDWMGGRDLFHTLEGRGIRLSYGSFSRMMRKLVEDAKVISHDTYEEFDGERIRVSLFRLP